MVLRPGASDDGAMSTRFEEGDWYEAPRYYDLVFDQDTELEAGFLEALAARYGRGAGAAAVLEPACGSGRLVATLAARGHAVTGFDASEAMLAFARERLARRRLTAELRRDRMEAFRSRRRYDLAHCLVSTFKYLLDEAAARAHLEAVARVLRRGGLYVVGLHLSEYGSPHRVRERWVVERGRTRVVCNIQTWPADRARRLERVRSRLTVEEHGRTRRFETRWLFRTYDARELRRLVASVPALEHVATFDFTYDLGAERRLDDEQLDCVLVLRRT